MNPHDVDEVPVDPCALDAHVGIRSEVPAHGPDVHDRQKRQPDEDVRTVQTGEAVEDGGKGAVVNRKPRLEVLVDLGSEEDGPMRKVVASPTCRPVRLLRLIEWSA